MKKFFAMLLILTMAVSLLSAIPQAAFAAERTVSINGLSAASDINAAIKRELDRANSGDTVIVTGSATTDFAVEVNVPAGKTLVWKAKMSADYVWPGYKYAGLLSVSGSGVFEVADGADLSMYSPGNGNIAINVFESSAKINITGGKIAAYANSGYTCHAVGSSKSNVDINVSGNAHLIARAYGTGTANVIDLEDSNSNVTISGNARLEGSSENNEHTVAGIAYTELTGNAIGDINITGGEIIITSKSANACGLYAISGNISMSGGKLSVSTTGGSNTTAMAMRIGDDKLDSRYGPAGSINVSGGTVDVTNNSTNGWAFLMGVYDHDSNVNITGGNMSVKANSNGGAAYGVFCQNTIRANVTMTGGTLSSTAKLHAYGMRIVDGTAVVSGGSVSAVSTDIAGYAIFIAKRGVAVARAGTYTGHLLLHPDEATGIMVEAASLTVRPEQRGTNEGLKVIRSNGITSAGAIWDNTATSADKPYVTATGAGAAGLPKAQFGNYPGSAAAATGNREAVAAFVTRLYDNVLGRSPHITEVNEWVRRLLAGEYTGSGVAYDFFFSIEFTGKNVSNSVYIDTLYYTLMGRAPDSAGKAHHLNSLNTGWTRLQLFEHFVVSPEFTGICESYGIIR